MQPNPRNDRSDDEQKNNDQRPGQDWRRWLWPGVLLFILLWTIAGSNLLQSAGSAASEIDFSQLQNNLQCVDAITVAGDGVNVSGEFRPSAALIAASAAEGTTSLPADTGAANQVVECGGETVPFRVIIPEGSGFDIITALREANPSAVIDVEAPPDVPIILTILIQFLPLLLIIAFFVWMSRRAQGQMNGVFGFGRSQAREYDAQMPRVTFDDVAGQDAAKKELVEVVDFLKTPEKYISLGARIPRGVLLVGPPGTGKTLMARAVAGEANVAFYSIAASEFVEMFVGVGASRVRDLFNKAKQNSPSIVFIDEIDAVGRQRGAGLGGGNDEREQTLNQMLAELDGFDQSSTVIVMAATNRPDVLDPALLRPGRFDRQVTVDLPDKTGRTSILKIHTRGKPLDSEVDIESIAGATIGFSGADLANLANEAALNAARNDRKKIFQEDFSTAFERIILGTERPPLSNQEERRVVAYHEAGHALTALLTPGADQVLKVTITPRGQALGVTAFTQEDDRRNYPKSYLEARIRTGLGGRIAEETVFGEVTTGAQGDIVQITRLARGMVTQFGMSSLGTVDYSNGGNQPFLGYSLSQGRQYSEETAARVDSEVREIIEEAYADVTNLLTENRDKLDQIANMLMQQEIIERHELLELMGMAQDKPLDTPEQVLANETELEEFVDVPGTDLIDEPQDGSENDGDLPDGDDPNKHPLA